LQPKIGQTQYHCPSEAALLADNKVDLLSIDAGVLAAIDKDSLSTIVLPNQFIVFTTQELELATVMICCIKHTWTVKKQNYNLFNKYQIG
jgi:hypothetical protein